MTTGKLIVDDRRLDRRAVLGGAAGAAAAGLVSRAGAPTLAATQDATSSSEGGAATFVLVHGSWAGAWIWRPIVPLLRAAGHEVYASTATGMGDRVHLADPAIDLDTFVTDVVNLLEYEELTDVTLVGWSFGGMTITGVAERVPERLARVVYLDAFVPEDGRSANDYAPLSQEPAGVPGYLPVFLDLVHGMTKDPAVKEWLLSKFTPQPLPSFTQPIALGDPVAATLPRAFIHCTENPIEPFITFATRLRSDPLWAYRELADNHFAPVNVPQATAEAILSLL
jgi:pimeloyl-ACP methyl ester carboxylesterase